MKLFGDYHTHTIFSHGKGTIFDNANQAKDCGLKEIAITDHGFGHQLYGVKRKKFLEMRPKVIEAEKFTNVKIYLGLETNLCSSDGDLDITNEELENLDILLVGFHRFVKCSFRDKFKLFLPNVLIKKVSQKQKERNTLALLKAMDKYPIDIITHIGYGFAVDLKKIGEKAVQTHTYIELNEHKMLLSQDEVNMLLNLGVEFIISSDAHIPSNVGNTPKMLEIVKNYGIPLDRIANLNKIPKFKK